MYISVGVIARGLIRAFLDFEIFKGKLILKGKFCIEKIFYIEILYRKNFFGWKFLVEKIFLLGTNLGGGKEDCRAYVRAWQFITENLYILVASQLN